MARYCSFEVQLTTHLTTMLRRGSRTPTLVGTRLLQPVSHPRSRLLTTVTTSVLPSSIRPHRSSLVATAAPLPLVTRSPRRSIQQKTSGPAPEWTTSTRGSPQTETFRLYFHRRSDPNQPLSPWHDIPLHAPAATNQNDSTERLYHYVNEIPRGTTAKMEVSTTTKHNPIAQDIKKGKLRHFTYGDIPFNYGCLPQTWEDPSATHPETGCNGDNDPVDVVELSRSPLAVGSVHSVRVLGVLALIDEGETDWKLLAVNSADPLYSRLSSVDDVERELPGLVARVKEWFKYYKTTDGKAENVLGFDERVLGVAEAEAVIQETHEAWKALVEGKKEPAGLWLRDGKVMGANSSKQ